MKDAARDNLPTKAPLQKNDLLQANSETSIDPFETQRMIMARTRQLFFDHANQCEVGFMPSKAFYIETFIKTVPDKKRGIADEYRILYTISPEFDERFKLLAKGMGREYELRISSPDNVSEVLGNIAEALEKGEKKGSEQTPLSKYFDRIFQPESPKAGRRYILDMYAGSTMEAETALSILSKVKSVKLPEFHSVFQPTLATLMGQMGKAAS